MRGSHSIAGFSRFTGFVSAVGLVALLSLAVLSGVAHAAYTDCSDAAYLRKFAPDLTTATFQCEERSRVSVMTEAGPREIRLLYAAGLEVSVSPMLLREFERALQAIPSAAGQLGNFRMSPVSVLVMNEALEAGDPSAHAASSHTDAHIFYDMVASTTWVEDECLVQLRLLDFDARVESAAPVLIHEVFHCIQLATLTPDLMKSGGAGLGVGGDWWLEGSAEWFAALALPEAELLQDRLARFDHVSADTPLYGMSYEAVVFFLWLGELRQAQAILPFLQRMAEQGGASAQAAAMTQALSIEEWLDFARHYLEGNIAHPHGTPLKCDSAAGARNLSAASGGLIELEPFILYRGWYQMECASPSGAAVGNEYFRFVGLAAGEGRVSLPLASALLDACRPCQGAAAIEACLVGVSYQARAPDF